MWISSGALMQGTDGSLKYRESISLPPSYKRKPQYSEPIISRKSIRYDDEKDCLPQQIRPKSPLLTLPSIREYLSDASAVFVGTVEEIALGFYFSDPHKLVTVRANRWLRAPTSGEEDILRIPIEGATFTIGDKVYCKKPSTDWFEPIKGMRVVVIATTSPEHRKEGIINIDPTLVFIEKEDGAPGFFSGRESDPDLKDLEDFDAMVERIQGMLKEEPYRFELDFGLDF
jgi:hypothetical protein